MECAGCGAALTKRHQKVFCSNRCQRAHERARNVEAWLATGLGTPGSRPEHFIRMFISDDQQGRCAICGTEPIWNGAPMTLVLDHVDGDSTNNRRDNLRMVCPNCDSQLPTFKARNRGNGRAWRRQRYAEGKSY
jgi:endogenous inhibitor of DNA gyrase (YacG/DUF329 family)